MPTNLNHVREEIVLRRALEKGLIKRTDLDEIESSKSPDDGAPPENSRIERLRKAGRLSDEQLEALIKETEHPTLTLAGMTTIEVTLVAPSTEDQSSTLKPAPSTVGLAHKSEPSAPVSSSRFPVVDWTRYRFVKSLGEGGMGVVYLAEDPALNRMVALKFLRNSDPQLIRRFLQEAKAQARIEHPNICKVYEVGEVENHHYIAMQYVEGPSLHWAKDQLTVEQKVKIIRDSAVALQSAHRIGIIHRDIKPANIMIEQEDDGDWTPRLMDFGLARESGAGPGLTETGMILGTPSYMSPEQAKGDIHNLDRRSDVYSLGATLYDLLAGRPPFTGTTSYQILIGVIEKDPVPLHKFVPGISSDLETVVMKCLEKEPQRRYQTSKALARDLQRYLDGDAILAQRSTWTYRFKKYTRKNKLVVATACVALSLVLIFSAITLQTRWNADRQAKLAQQFGQEAERIESILQRAYLLPPHNIRTEKRLAETRLDQIRTLMEQAGSVGQGAGHYALARGYSALRDYQNALIHAETARKNGFQSAESACLRGQILGELYRRELAQAERIPNAELRAIRKVELEARYGAPGIADLNVCASAPDTGDSAHEAVFVEAKIAFCKKEYAAALLKAQNAFGHAPWLYEALKLQGDVYLALGREKWERGDYDEALSRYDDAGRAFTRAAEIGRSDPDLYLAETERKLSIVEVQIRRGTLDESILNAAFADCDKALQINPEEVEALHKMSRGYWRLGEFRNSHGEDPRPSFMKAIETARAAERLNPRDVNVYRNLGNAYRLFGEFEMQSGGDPQSSFRLSIENFNKAVELDPTDTFAYNNLGNTYMSAGLAERNRGQSPVAPWNRAVDAYQKAIELNPAYAGFYNNIGGLYVDMAQYAFYHGQDPTELLDKSLTNYKQAAFLNPNLANAYVGLGLTHHLRGRLELYRGGDPREFLKRADEQYRKSLEINPTKAFALNNLGFVLELRAKYELTHDLDPTATLDEARPILDRSVKIDASDGFSHANRAMIETQALRWATLRRQPGKPFFEQAKGLLESAVKANPRNDFFRQATAELYRREAERRIRAGENPGNAIKLGLEAAETARSLNSQNAEVRAIEGVLCVLAAETDKAARPNLLRRAADCLEQALRINGFLKTEYGPILDGIHRR